MHRNHCNDAGGFSAKANILAQFKVAANQGVDIIETDLRLTRDSVVVVFHDKRLSKETNCSGSIESKTLTEVKKCKFKKTSEPIPTSAELLEWADGKVLIKAELKTDDVVEHALYLSSVKGFSESVFF